MLWLWGLAGAFIYAGPRWVIDATAAWEAKRSAVPVTMGFIVAMIVGPLCAAAFGSLTSSVALTTLGIKDENAIYALIGLFANRVAPEVVERGTKALSGSAEAFDRVLAALKGKEK